MENRRTWHTLAQGSGLLLLAASWLGACGARSAGFDDLAEAGQGGGSAVGGRGGAGKGGTSGKAGAAGSGGSSGSGPCAGAGSCTCTWNGAVYHAGDTFPAGDGCNHCSCLEDGAVSCTQIGCNLCLTYENSYAAAYEQAKSCDPTLSFAQCSRLVEVGLVCSCPTYLNVLEDAAIETMLLAREGYGSASCGWDVVCGACAVPVRGQCNLDGRCADIWD